MTSNHSYQDYLSDKTTIKTQQNNATLEDFLLLITKIGDLMPATMQIHSILLHHKEIQLQLNNNQVGNSIIFARAVQQLIPQYHLKQFEKNNNNQLSFSLKANTR